VPGQQPRHTPCHLSEEFAPALERTARFGSRLNGFEHESKPKGQGLRAKRRGQASTPLLSRSGLHQAMGTIKNQASATLTRARATGCPARLGVLLLATTEERSSRRSRLKVLTAPSLLAAPREGFTPPVHPSAL
jgi:hypothetical protein